MAARRPITPLTHRSNSPTLRRSVCIRMLELETALERILAAVPPVSSDSIALAEAHGRILGERILSPLDLPVFDNSAMDGYAVHATEVAQARPDAPVRSQLIYKET